MLNRPSLLVKIYCSSFNVGDDIDIDDNDVNKKDEDNNTHYDDGDANNDDNSSNDPIIRNYW